MTSQLPPALTDRVAFLLQLALRRAQDMGEAALTGLGITGREYGALAVLASLQPAVQHQVGAALGVDRTTTAALIGGLQERGLVDRTRDPQNRRAYLVRLSPDGERVRARAEAVLADCDDRFLAALTGAERDRLAVALRRLAAPDKPP